MKRSYIVANWKMNLAKGGIDAYFDALSRGVAAHDEVEVVVAPPYPFLTVALEAAPETVRLAAQDCSTEASGAFTGEVSAAMLRQTGAEFVIAGHSERRKYHAESDETVGRKLAAIGREGMLPIFCIGESLETREGGKTAEFLARQLSGALSMVGGAVPLILAYEPIWAIGTGRNASGAMVAETLASITEALGKIWSPAEAAKVPILYGGSVTPDNVAELSEEGNVDGFLVGGASLDAAKFIEIHEGYLRSKVIVH